jgi:hypothetical protein
MIQTPLTISGNIGVTPPKTEPEQRVAVAKILLAEDLNLRE